MSRTPLVAGNWKLHHGIGPSVELARAVAAAPREGVEVVVAPVFTALTSVKMALEGTGVGLAGQNMHFEDKGAFTGEVSGPLLRDVGCTHVIVGHSERRQYFGESDEGVRKKTVAALAHGLTPIVCVGETLAEREAGKTLEVVLGQIDRGLAGHDEGALSRVVIAYEPVWAIGTGKVAKASDAQEVHAAIRARMAERFERVAATMRILYGGSVKADNASELLAQADIDGALVGGASLDASQFGTIIAAAAH